MMRITVQLSNEVGHDFKLGVVGDDVNVEIAHVDRGISPPVFTVIGNVVAWVDDGRFAILRTS